MTSRSRPPPASANRARRVAGLVELPKAQLLDYARLELDEVQSPIVVRIGRLEGEEGGQDRRWATARAPEAKGDPPPPHPKCMRTTITRRRT